METTSIITFLAGTILIAIFGKFLLFPLKKILKLILNSVLGGLLIFIINLIGGLFNFHIGLNMVTSMFVRSIRHSRSRLFNNIKINIELKAID